MKRLLIGSVALLLLVPAASQAQPPIPSSQTPSIRDIAELTKAGVDEDVILALIEVNRPVYPVDADTLKGLKTAGISPRVIVAMVRSGRSEHAAAPVAAPARTEAHAEPAVQSPPPPQVIVVDHESPRATREVREVAVPVPVYVTFPSRSRIDDHDRRPPRAVEPVYWGWGGKLRPDAWKPSVKDLQKDARVEPAQKK